MPATEHSRAAAVETSSKNKKTGRKEEPAPRKPVEFRQPSTAQQGARFASIAGRGGRTDQRTVGPQVRS